MGGGTMHVDHPAPQYRSTLNKFSLSSSSSSSSSSSNLNPPVSTDSSMLFTPYNSLSCCCCCHIQLCRKMEMGDGKEAKTASGCRYKHVFEPVPSQWEIEDAVSALKDFMQAVSSSNTIQQIAGSYDSRIVLSKGYIRLYDALHLLQADPSIKRLVVSLSSDKAIWDAVMSNVLHHKVLEFPDSVECSSRSQISEQKEFGIHILSWILDIIKPKILVLMESFQSLMNDVFQFPRMENATADATELDEKVRSSLVLSILILLIVIMTRSQRF
ncbi:uncharacterized protein LOC133313914 isoform X1 [Gastrolobium bilobum]|uniref:uncharacterized protein LOC133313914 isoform X1 n=1 Tax=Gastrolobium bilobum TaxID=150636 RepID=UPI002AB2F8AB|nr:uncharacterized protein LOC133313914 isoform X1 [Gastrolobium bilobum]